MECDGLGAIALSDASEIDYLDTRSMITHDNQFLCGHCVDREPRRWDGGDAENYVTMIALRDPTAEDKPFRTSSLSISIKNATHLIGKRDGYLFSAGIFERVIGMDIE